MATTLPASRSDAPEPSSAFLAFEACKTTTGAAFVTAWRALARLEPSHAPGALLVTKAANLADLDASDWTRIARRMDDPLMDERVREPVLARWAVAHDGDAFLPAWARLAVANPGWAADVLEARRSRPGRPADRRDDPLAGLTGASAGELTRLARVAGDAQAPASARALAGEALARLAQLPPTDDPDDATA